MVEEERRAEIERRLGVLTADRNNWGLTSQQEVEFNELKKELAK